MKESTACKKFESTVLIVSIFTCGIAWGGYLTEHLVRLTEPKGHLILVHELAILLGTFGPHFDG